MRIPYYESCAWKSVDNLIISLFAINFNFYKQCFLLSELFLLLACVKNSIKVLLQKVVFRLPN